MAAAGTAAAQRSDRQGCGDRADGPGRAAPTPGSPGTLGEGRAPRSVPAAGPAQSALGVSRQWPSRGGRLTRLSTSQVARTLPLSLFWKRAGARMKHTLGERAPQASARLWTINTGAGNRPGEEEGWHLPFRALSTVCSVSVVQKMKLENISFEMSLHKPQLLLRVPSVQTRFRGSNCLSCYLDILEWNQNCPFLQKKAQK